MKYFKRLVRKWMVESDYRFYLFLCNERYGMSVSNILAIVTLVFGIIVSVIGFFLKRSFKSLDTKASKEEVNKKASKEEVETLDDEVCKLRSSVDTIKTDYLTKEDFFREQAKTDRKLERIIEILMEMQGGKRG